MLVTLGSRCAGALERASLYERERSVALALQQRLLSVLPTTPAWLGAAARYVPATGLEIGGDWFQILDAGDGRIAAIVGDAVGHGVTSAAAMGQLRASIATAFANDPRPGHTLAAVDLFARRGSDTLGASVGSVLLDPNGDGIYACAGLPPPLLVKPGKRVRFLAEGRRPLLGLGDPTVDYPDDSFSLSGGDLIVMYTDGLVERRGETIDSGLERLRRSVEMGWHLPPEDLCDLLLTEVGGDELDDDVALLILAHRPNTPIRT
jgi:serine phosphatase RsbU (regulator of sigma subunit)